jgi:spore coat protein CotF
MPSSLTDKEMLNDTLNSQKLIENNYNTFANECVNPQLRDDFINILREEHDLAFNVFQEMSQRGWYQTKSADANEVTMAKNKYSNML